MTTPPALSFREKRCLQKELTSLIEEAQQLTKQAADIEQQRAVLRERISSLFAALGVGAKPSPKPEPQAAATPTQPELFDELAALCKASLAWAKKHGYPEVQSYPQYLRAREIGEALFAAGGLSVMQQAVHYVYEHVKSRDGGQATLAEYGWQGIGGWQS